MGTKKKQSTILLSILVGLLFIFPGPLTVAEEQEIADEIVIDNPGYKTDRKGRVAFSHLSHIEDYGVSCEDCHHVYQGGKNIWEEGDPVANCASCHSPLESNEGVKKLSIAFHRNCKTCHRNLAKEGITKEAPYKSCYECHVRRR